MIKVNNLTKIFNGNDKSRNIALDDVSFEIKKGEIVSIVGRTGSGKTTISNLLLGILKPTSGEIKIGDNLTINKKTKKKELRKITEMLLSSFQYPDHQLFNKTVREEILFNNEDNKKNIDGLMKFFNLPESTLDKSPYKLSSGEKRKIILIALLMREPEILVLDEPTAFLDSRTREEFVGLIKKINKEKKTTIVFISHNLNDVSNISNRTILLKDGKVAMFDKTNKVINKYKEGDYYE